MYPPSSSLLGPILGTLLFFALTNVGFPLLASSLPPGMGETLYLRWEQSAAGASTARGLLLWVSLGSTEAVAGVGWRWG